MDFGSSGGKRKTDSAEFRSLRKKTTLKWVNKRKASESFPQMFGYSSRLIYTSATGSKELKVNPINALDGM